MRNFHAEVVCIWPFTGTSRQGGCHRDRALEVAYQPPAAQRGHNEVPVGHIYPKHRSGASFGHAATGFPNARFPAQSVARALVLLRVRGQVERQWEQEPSHHPEGQVQRALWLQAMYCARRFYAELVPELVVVLRAHFPIYIFRIRRYYFLPGIPKCFPFRQRRGSCW